VCRRVQRVARANYRKRARRAREASIERVPLTVGTAGHIDHGKTWLVRALTGKDTDRLPEEQRRGISIELGYAPLELPDGRQLSVVDVPGHERFVRTMVAGATGIDLFLLVIDAAEGARPQTHEHLAILRLLGIQEGVVAVTKADAVDEEVLELALEEARELVPGAEVVAVSAKTGAGLDELRAALGRAGDRIAHEPVFGATRLYVDRVFTLRGIGTVATGTLWAGTVAEGDSLRAEPAAFDVRVRSVQVHDRPVDRAEAGQRVAVALTGLERSALRRGDALIEPGAYPVSYRLDVALEELGPIPPRASVHHGTAEAIARVVRVGDGYAQLRLAEPFVAARGDRVVLRAGTTVGGGRLLDPAPPRRVDPERLALLDRGDPASIARATVEAPVTRAQLAARGLLAAGEIDAALAALERAGEWYLGQAWLEDLRTAALQRLERRAATDAIDPGIPLAELLPSEPWAGPVFELLGIERRGANAYLPGQAAKLGAREEAARALEAAAEASGFEPVRVDDRELGRFLEQEGRLVRLGDGLAIGRESYERGFALLTEECASAGTITLARFRDLIGTGRRPAQLLLERFDADGHTRRVGDARVLRRAAAAKRA
jgi:selenocysteine-specific elongation factor